MNCKPGDLAIVIKAETETQHVGKIVRVIELHPDQDAWWTEPQLQGRCGRNIWWYDRNLRPVSGLPMKEETEQKLKEPA